MADRTVQVRLDANVLGYRRAMRDATDDTRGLERQVGRSSSVIDSRMKAAGLAVGAVGIAAAGVFTGLKYAVDSAADFEQRLDAIAAVSGSTTAEMEQLRRKALELGESTVFSASESAAAMEELIKAGLTVDDVLTGAADAAVALAAAGGVEIPEAAALAANAMSVFNLKAPQMAKVADLIAGAANASAIDVSEFGMALQQSGAVANLSGVSFEELSVAIAAMGNAGIKGSDAGTSLKTFLGNLIPTTSNATAAFEELGLITEENGNIFFDAEGQMRDLSVVAGELNESLEGLSEKDRTRLLEAAFGTDAIRAAAVLAEEGEEGLRGLADAMGAVTAEDVAEKRMDNFAGAMEELKGSVENLAIRVGEKLIPYLEDFADWITENMPEIADAVVNGVDNMLDALHDFADWWDDNQAGIKDAGNALAQSWSADTTDISKDAGDMARAVGAATDFLNDAMDASVNAGAAFREWWQLTNLYISRWAGEMALNILTAFQDALSFIPGWDDRFSRGLEKLQRFVDRANNDIDRIEDEKEFRLSMQQQSWENSMAKLARFKEALNSIPKELHVGVHASAIRDDLLRSLEGRHMGGTTSPGWMMAGERGPELVYSGQGTKTLNHETTMRALGHISQALPSQPSFDYDRLAGAVGRGGDSISMTVTTTAERAGRDVNDELRKQRMMRH